jgi:hypothetical protein
MVNPEKIRAGIWKHNDFPPPVGMMTMLSFFLKTFSIISAWRGLNSSYPKTVLRMCFDLLTMVVEGRSLLC